MKKRRKIIAFWFFAAVEKEENLCWGNQFLFLDVICFCFLGNCFDQLVVFDLFSLYVFEVEL